MSLTDRCSLQQDDDVHCCLFPPFKQKESLKYFAEKEALVAQVTSLQHELATCQKSALETTARLKQEVNNKLKRLKEETEANKRLQPELERLRVQVRT